MPTGTIPADIPPEAVAFLEDVGYFQDSPLKVGDSAPLLNLAPLCSGGSVRTPVPGRATVLIFGSFT